MAEVLSQQEIDQLLNNVKSGNEQVSETPVENQAIPFDFRLPNRISKNQLRLSRIFTKILVKVLAHFFFPNFRQW